VSPWSPTPPAGRSGRDACFRGLDGLVAELVGLGRPAKLGHKVGARSTGKGAAVGGVLLLLGPAALGVGLLGGGAAGALHYKSLGLTDADRTRVGAARPRPFATREPCLAALAG
jgi:hypothetical protein